jgi:hypothetical protein
MALNYITEQPLQGIDLLNIKPAQPGSDATLAVHVKTLMKNSHRHRRRNRKAVANTAFIGPLRRAVADSNRKLALRNSPFRLLLQMPADRIVLEIMRKETDGTFSTLSRHDITEEDFYRWIHDISELDGLQIDYSS